MIPEVSASADLCNQIGPLYPSEYIAYNSSSRQVILPFTLLRSEALDFQEDCLDDAQVRLT